MIFNFGKGPMLCKVYNPNKHKINKPMYLEPKYDGLRGIVVISGNSRKKSIEVLSRNNKPLWNTELIQEELLDLPLLNQVLDGEFYTEDWNLSMSITKTQTQGEHPDRGKLQFHIWDCIPIKDWNTWTCKLPLETRLSIIEPVLNKLDHIKLVKHKMVKSHEEIQTAYVDFLALGFEGGILKDPSSIYECGRRSPGWLKIKPWHDADLTIVGAYPGQGKHLGRLGGFVLTGSTEWNGLEVEIHTEVGTGFSDEQREAYQKLFDEGKLVGMTAEIKYQEITEDRACRFPVFNRLRTDK